MINKVRCMDWIDVGNEIWIISQEYNVLLHVEKKTKITRAEAFIERYPLYKAEWYYSSVLSGDYIVCIPALAKDIAIYSLSRGKTYYIHNADLRPQPKKESISSLTCYNAHIIKNR